MSTEEKNRITKKTFDVLWRELWGVNSTPIYRSEETSSSKKFEALTSGIVVNGETITLTDIVNRSTTTWKEQEWEFPKGRRNFKEKNIDCAKREFQEETNLSKNDYHIINHPDVCGYKINEISETYKIIKTLI